MSARTVRKLFGTDGIRGKANNGVLNADLAVRVGQAAAILFLRDGEQRHRVVIGKDTRKSCYMLEHGLCAGLLSAGMDVLLTGPIPTPAVAMLVRNMRLDFGIMITASHNPFEYNGIKLFGPDGYKFDDDKELEIERLVASDMSGLLAKSGMEGRAERDDGVQYGYIEALRSSVPKGIHFDGLRVVVDCANGAAYKVAPRVLKQLGAEVFEIGVSPNGININDNCGSTSPKALSQEVLRLRADVGIALDGDADRVTLVDENGTVVDGDQVLATMAESWMNSGRLANASVVGTVLSNKGMEHHLQTLGIQLLRAPVGDRHVLEMMREYGSNLGGEQSGHMIMSDLATTGDGMAAALQVLAEARRVGLPLSEVVHRFDPVPQVYRNIPFRPGAIDNPDFVGAIAEIERTFGEDGRLVVRPSGTEPLIRIMAEHVDLPSAKQAVDYLTQLLGAV